MFRKKSEEAVPGPSPLTGELFPVIILGGLGKGTLVFILSMGRKLTLDLLDPFNQQFHFRLLFAVRPDFRHRGDGFQLIGIRTGEIQGQFRCAGAYQLIQYAGGQNNRFQRVAGFAAQFPGAQRGQADGNSGLGIRARPR